MKTKSAQELRAACCVSTVVSKCHSVLRYCRRCVFFPPRSSSVSPCHTKANCAFPKAVLVLAPLLQPPRIRIFGPAMSVQFCQVCAEKENIGVTYTTQLLPRVMLSPTSVWCRLRSDVLKWHKATVRGHL